MSKFVSFVLNIKLSWSGVQEARPTSYND